MQAIRYATSISAIVAFVGALRLDDGEDHDSLPNQRLRQLAPSSLCHFVQDASCMECTAWTEDHQNVARSCVYVPRIGKCISERVVKRKALVAQGSPCEAVSSLHQAP